MINTIHNQHVIEQAHTHITHGELCFLFYKKKMLRFGEQVTLRLRDRKDKSDISDAYEFISYSCESSLVGGQERRHGLRPKSDSLT